MTQQTQTSKYLKDKNNRVIIPFTTSDNVLFKDSTNLTGKVERINKEIDALKELCSGNQGGELPPDIVQTIETIKNNIKELEKDSSYSSNIPSTVTVGGIKEGFTGNGQSVSEMLDIMLHPYVAPTLSISTNPTDGLFEKGFKINSVTVTSTARPTSKPIMNMKVLMNDVEVSALSFGNTVENRTIVYTSGEIKSNTSFKSTCNDSSGRITSSTKSYNFVYPLYVGLVDVVTEQNVKSLTKKVANPSTQVYTFTVTNQKICLAVPSNWTLKSIIDPNNFDITNSFDKIALNITCLDGSLQPYNVYTSAVTSQTNFTIRFNF